uniref:Uncharacterized protein n=1 Tax=Arundo donax TaxID=35708 RepID=A0A0A9CIQ8_ARUDO
MAVDASLFVARRTTHMKRVASPTNSRKKRRPPSVADVMRP